MRRWDDADKVFLGTAEVMLQIGIPVAILDDRLSCPKKNKACDVASVVRPKPRGTKSLRRGDSAERVERARGAKVICLMCDCRRTIKGGGGARGSQMNLHRGLP